MFQTVITGTGSYIPPTVVTNEDFVKHVFYADSNTPLTTGIQQIVEKFEQITGIKERRYTTDDLLTADIGAIAAKAAVQDSKIDPETIDQIIVAHNFGNVGKKLNHADTVPSLASRIKHLLGIQNPNCVAYDVLFGCPGWVQGIIHADAFFKAGIAKKALVIGTETLSRVIDKHDRDSMIFSDGAGAVIVEYKESNNEGSGVMGAVVQTHSNEEVSYIDMAPSYNQEINSSVFYLKMKGRKVYEYALKHVPAAIKLCLEKCNVAIKDVKTIFIHQANEKMDEAIIKRLYELYDTPPPPNIMPMSIHWLGNSSVATVPTLLDQVRKGQLPGYNLSTGDIILFASVGAGMNINAVCYRY